MAQVLVLSEERLRERNEEHRSRRSHGVKVYIWVLVPELVR